MTEETHNPAHTSDVEAHHFTASDENLMQAIAEVEAALVKLRVLNSASVRDDDVAAHGYRIMSDQNLKQVIIEVENALAKLRDLSPAGAGDVQAHHFQASDENLKQAIRQLDGALTKLREL